jgi:hypothetical protein
MKKRKNGAKRKEEMKKREKRGEKDEIRRNSFAERGFPPPSLSREFVIRRLKSGAEMKRAKATSTGNSL